MPRKQRQLLDGGYYHLIARGNNQLFLFSESGGLQKFKDILAQSKAKFAWQLLHYCLMSNHIHLLAQIGKGHELPKLMKFLLQCYSRWYQARTGYKGYLWEGRYKSPLISKESYLLECGRYIERNPVRAGIVRRAEDYSWSSYRHYAFGQPDMLVDDSPYFEPLGNSPETRQSSYREFVQVAGPYEPLVEESLMGTHF
jgi:putative transposase